jgi:magnesium chelatase family protein
VITARQRQRRRLGAGSALCNGDMDGRLTRRQVALDDRMAARLTAAGERRTLSGRGHDRVLRVARTIADLADREHVVSDDLDEALSHRLDDWERAAA